MIHPVRGWSQGQGVAAGVGVGFLPARVLSTSPARAFLSRQSEKGFAPAHKVGPCDKGFPSAGQHQVQVLYQRSGPKHTITKRKEQTHDKSTG